MSFYSCLMCPTCVYFKGCDPERLKLTDELNICFVFKPDPKYYGATIFK